MGSLRKLRHPAPVTSGVTLSSYSSLAQREGDGDLSCQLLYLQPRCWGSRWFVVFLSRFELVSLSWKSWAVSFLSEQIRVGSFFSEQIRRCCCCGASHTSPTISRRVPASLINLP